MYYDIILAIILFFVQNWIGSKSYTIGYISFSLLDDKDEALSLNFVIKVFGPIIFLILILSLFDFFNIDRSNIQVSRIIYFYLGLRLSLIILFERVTIVNWARIIFFYLSILLVTKIIEKRFIDSVSSLLPDLVEIKNELWLLIILFLYQVGNGFREDKSSPEPELYRDFSLEIKNRKKRYILKKQKNFETMYGHIINEIEPNDKAFKLIIICILIYENFNRPRIVRFFERLICKTFNRKTTQGIMQFSSKEVISDSESIKLGTLHLHGKYLKYLKDKAEENSYGSDEIYGRVIKRHCPDRNYIRQILFLAKIIIDNSENRNPYSELSDEIISEFHLYDIDE